MTKQLEIWLMFASHLKNIEVHASKKMALNMKNTRKSLKFNQSDKVA